MVLNNSSGVNGSNAHLPYLFGNKRGAVKGITVGRNHNIAPWPIRDNPHPGMKGGRRTRRRRRGRKRRRRRRSNRRRRTRRGARRKSRRKSRRKKRYTRKR